MRDLIVGSFFSTSWDREGLKSGQKLGTFCQKSPKFDQNWARGGKAKTLGKGFLTIFDDFREF